MLKVGGVLGGLIAMTFSGLFKLSIYTYICNKHMQSRLVYKIRGWIIPPCPSTGYRAGEASSFLIQKAENLRTKEITDTSPG